VDRADDLEPADYTVASGVFIVKLDVDDASRAVERRGRILA
jgi:hypothetical protein